MWLFLLIYIVLFIYLIKFSICWLKIAWLLNRFLIAFILLSYIAFGTFVLRSAL